jgi:hypothetical protein
MTLKEAYGHLAQPLTMFGKTYPAVINGELTIEKLQQYAKECQSSKYPAVKAIGNEINTKIFNAGFDLNNTF